MNQSRHLFKQIYKPIIRNMYHSPTISHIRYNSNNSKTTMINKFNTYMKHSYTYIKNKNISNRIIDTIFIIFITPWCVIIFSGITYVTVMSYVIFYDICKEIIKSS